MASPQMRTQFISYPSLIKLAKPFVNVATTIKIEITIAAKIMMKIPIFSGSKTSKGFTKVSLIYFYLWDTGFEILFFKNMA